MFKHTGIIRRMDDLGRVVVPKEMRQRFHVKENDPFEVGYTEDSICLKKYSPIECFCEETKQIAYAFSKVTGMPVMLCDTNTVIASMYIANVDNMRVSDELYECMIQQLECGDAVSVIKDTDIQASALEWIRHEDNIIGALIIPKCKQEVTQSHNECLKVCANAISAIIN